MDPDAYASKFERKYVHEVYDLTARHFSASRRTRPWPCVASFLENTASGSLLADIGCGDGRYRTVNQNLQFICVDMSVPLLEVAMNRNGDEPLAPCECVSGNAMVIPLRDNSVDAAISVAVLHHLSTRQRRVAAVRELLRICRPGGRILVAVWAIGGSKPTRTELVPDMERPSNQAEGSETFVHWALDPRYLPS